MSKNKNEGWFRVGGFAVGAFKIRADNSKCGGWLSFWQGENGYDDDAEEPSKGCDYFSGRAVIDSENDLLWLSSWKSHGYSENPLANELGGISQLPKWTETRWCLKGTDIDGSSLFDCKNDCVASPTDPEAVEFWKRYNEAERIRAEELKKPAGPERPALLEQQAKSIEGTVSLF